VIKELARLAERHALRGYADEQPRARDTFGAVLQQCVAARPAHRGRPFIRHHARGPGSALRIVGRTLAQRGASTDELAVDLDRFPAHQARAAVVGRLLVAVPDAWVAELTVAEDRHALERIPGPALARVRDTLFGLEAVLQPHVARDGHGGEVEPRPARGLGALARFFGGRVRRGRVRAGRVR